MNGRFHVKAWLAWLVAASVIALSISNPLVSMVALGAMGVTAAACVRHGPEGRGFPLLLRVGMAIILFRVVLFGLTGHTGATTLFTLPTLGLPAVLGGFSLGGRVTGEVLAQQVAEGIVIATFLAAVGVFLSVVETYRVLRLVPRFLFEAGLVVSIALAFVPTMLRGAVEIRDAQRVRGHRFRGLRSLRPLVVPVLACALERSLALAESMEARGYGRLRREAAGGEALARAGVLAGLVALTGGGAMLLLGRGPAAASAVLAAGGAAALVTSLGLLSRAVERTRLRPERLDRWDLALLITSLATAGAALGARSLPEAGWYAYPAVAAPSLHPMLVGLGASLAAPAVVAAVRAARMRRAGARHPRPLEAPARRTAGATR